MKDMIKLDAIRKILNSDKGTAKEKLNAIAAIYFAITEEMVCHIVTHCGEQKQEIPEPQMRRFVEPTEIPDGKAD